jgi:hypothetical protein
MNDAFRVADELLVLARTGDADRLATALVATAAPRAAKTFREVLERLVDTFSGTTRSRRRSLRVTEPFVLRLRDQTGYSIRIHELDAGVAAVAGAIAASVRGDRDTHARQLRLACERTAIQDRIRVLANCVAWTADLLGTDPTAYPPVLSCPDSARTPAAARRPWLTTASTAVPR